MTRATDHTTAMHEALRRAASVRTLTSPNPWVGAVVLDRGGQIAGTGATEPPGGAHAEVVALTSAGERARGGTLVVTLEPCSHHGRTPPCVDAVLAAGVTTVVVAVTDPDPRVSGAGVAALRHAGVEVIEGVSAEAVADQLAPYLHHRRTGRPFVIAKAAVTLDGAIAAPDGSSRWITGDAARADAHQLRAESDAIVVGAGTVRVDDPSLTVRHVDGRDPLRVVVGRAPRSARVHPCLEWDDTLEALLDELGRRGVLQVMVEGGARLLRSFHDLDLVDRSVFYVAPTLLAGNDMVPVLAGPSAPSLADAWRGRFVGVRQLGADLRLDLVPHTKE